MRIIAKPSIKELDERSREIFREIVETYVQTGEPSGSRTISRRLSRTLSPATVRNVMADLEEMGLLYAPHVSAGRLPTDLGLRLFVDGLLEVGSLNDDERARIELHSANEGRPLAEALAEATEVLSGLAQCAGLVVAPKTERAIKHIDFVNIGDGRVLVVLVTEDGVVENRLINLPMGTPPSALVYAANYLNARLVGHTLDELQGRIRGEIELERVELDALTRNLVEAGLAMWAGETTSGSLIIKGQARLLENVSALADLERVRMLFEALETKELLVRVLEASHQGEGVKIFIGAENKLFGMAGCSMVVAPYKGASGRLVGAIGVIGPTRLNYARIIPMVDYTARIVSRFIN